MPKKKPKRQPSLTRHLPYWHCTHDGIVFNHQGTLEFGIELGLPGSTLSTEDELESLARQITLMIRGDAPLEERTRFYLVVSQATARIPDYTINKISKASNPNAKHLAQKRVEHYMRKFEAGKLRTWRVFLFQTLTPPRGKLANTAYSEVEFDEATAKARELRQTYLSHLTKFGISARALDFDGVMSVAYDYFNPDRAGKLPDPEIGTIREQLSRSPVQNYHYDRIKVGETWVSGITYPTIPSELTLGAISRFLPDKGEAIVVIDLFKLPPNSTSNKLELEYSRIKDLHGKLGSPGNVAKLEELEAAIRRITGRGENVLDANVLIILRDKDRESLLKRRLEVKTALAHASGGQATDQIGNFYHYWLSAAPASGSKLPRLFSILDGDSMYLLPVQSPWTGSTKPIYLAETFEGTLVGVNPFDPSTTNHNGIIIGTSGSGKTYFTQSLLAAASLEEASITIVDKGKSYLPLVKLLEGNIVFLEPGNKAHSINPFDLPAGATSPTPEKSGRLVLLIRSMLGDINHNAATVNGLILAAIKDTYERALTREYDEKEDRIVETFTAPTLSDFVSSLHRIDKTTAGEQLTEKQRDIAKDIALQLSSWTGDTPYGTLVDRPTNIKLSAKTNYFDVSALDSYPDLLRVAVLLIAESIMDNVYSAPSRTGKLVVFDEVWDLLRNEASRTLIEDLFRRLRKYGGGAIAVTQSLSELSDEGVKGIMANVSHYYFLSMNNADVVAAQKILGYPEQVAERHKDIRTVPGDHSEMLYLMRNFHGLSGSFLRLPNIPTEYWYFTNNPNDLYTRSKYEEAYGDLKTAIDQILKDGVIPTEPLDPVIQRRLESSINKEAEVETA